MGTGADQFPAQPLRLFDQCHQAAAGRGHALGTDLASHQRLAHGVGDAGDAGGTGSALALCASMSLTRRWALPRLISTARRAIAPIRWRSRESASSSETAAASSTALPTRRATPDSTSMAAISGTV